MSVIVTVAPTGPLATKADNPALPNQPVEIAVAEAQAAGAAIAHIHLRDEHDRPPPTWTSPAARWT